MSSFSSFEKDKERFDVWREFLLAEELKPCGDSALTFDQFITAIELASMDAQKRVQKREELEKTGKMNEALMNIFTVASIVATLPFMGAIAGLTVASTVVAAVAGFFRMKQKDKANEGIDSMRDFSQHLMDWLNTRSEYAKSDRTSVVPTK